MEILSWEFASALLAIVMIDLVLAGDNAIVIGLAARKLEKEQQKKVIFWGTVGAIAIRMLATLVVVWLLKIPGLLAIGGIMLIWIAYKLLTDDAGHEVKAGNSVWAAIRTIIIADALMGLDNVLAVAGAAHGSALLVVLGLLISVPLVVWGSTIILKWVDRFPVIITAGSAILAWTASKMLLSEPFVKELLDGQSWLKWVIQLTVIVGVVAAGKMKQQVKEKAAA